MTRWARPVLILAVLVAGVAGARALGLGDLIRLENVARLKQWIEGFGVLAPVVFIAGYILAEPLYPLLEPGHVLETDQIAEPERPRSHHTRDEQGQDEHGPHPPPHRVHLSHVAKSLRTVGVSRVRLYMSPV